jgi:hypothetical protein
VTILDAISKPKLFARWFEGDSWNAWRTFMKVLFALPFDPQDLERYQKHTGRTTVPTQPFNEAWVVAGRRAGKSLIASLTAVYLACFRDYRQYLQAGEYGTIGIVAADRKQARTCLRYVKGFLSVPILSKLVESDTADSVTLTNKVVIEVHTASWRSVRGYSLLACIADEIAFWRSDESANPDFEIISAVRPGLATIPNSLLLCISSPYARRGSLWNAYSKHFGKESDTLVWQATSREMNPSLRQSVIDRAMEEDEASARAEYLAEFRRDIESFIDSVLVQSLVIPGRIELPYVHGTVYVGFVDPSGGSGQDSYTLSIAHRERNGTFVIDLIREVRPPFSPEAITAEFAATLKSYGIKRIWGDRYAGSWPAERFAKNGITYVPCPWNKSEIYKDTLPLLNSRQVELLDNKRLISQLCGLERRTARSGNDSIDHGPNQHDDVINCVAGSLNILRAARRRRVGAWAGAPIDRLSNWQWQGVNEHAWRTWN